ncbi:SDA1 -like protein [Brachionus plicatilis]|uniref:Protein SDA1 n=1 Tax=Brachionus plicatilis TaxID=10195 RepID=A0A3M7TCK9_BRAPC|nr:SDA1 -like protein [Brachionus plicatilis]
MLTELDQYFLVTSLPPAVNWVRPYWISRDIHHILKKINYFQFEAHHYLKKKNKTNIFPSRSVIEMTSTKNHFATNLLQLQNRIKRDPTSYKDEFSQTYLNYESTLQAYLMKPAKPNKQLADLSLFLAHVSHCFTDELKQYPQQLIDILKRYATVLNPEMRLLFCW